jgi:Fe-S cluster assembly protein SufD
MSHQQETNMWYQSSFELFEKSLNGEAATPVHAIRRGALERFHAVGFPTTKNEEWRFTNVAPIAKAAFTPTFGLPGHIPSVEELDRFTFGTPHRLVFVNGHFAKDLSTVGKLPAGVVLTNLATALKQHRDLVDTHFSKYASYDDNPFVALNTAFAQDGAFIYLPHGCSVDDAISLLFVAVGSEPFYIPPRNLIVLEERAQLQMVESFVSTIRASYFTNVVSEISLGKGAVLEHDKLQNESLQAFHIAAIHVHQQERSNFTSNSIALGGSLVRNNVTTVLGAEWCEATLNGLSVGTGTQLIDNHTTIDHATPNCASHELYKAILDGKSRGVFNGKIFVRKDAQKTDAKQTNMTLLLSDDATIDTKPQLEIFADDVRCTHGATVGQLDENQIFYLRSRGIDENLAADILTFAFAGDVVNRVHVPALREQLEFLVHAKLIEGRKS